MFRSVSHHQANTCNTRHTREIQKCLGFGDLRVQFYKSIYMCTLRTVKNNSYKKLKKKIKKRKKEVCFRDNFDEFDLLRTVHRDIFL